MARVVGADGSAVTQSDISTAEYSIYLLDDQDPDSLTAVDDHNAVSLTVSSVVYDTLQTDDRWDEDGTGYNFLHVIQIDTSNAFAIAGRNYQAEYILTPTDEQPVIVRFQLQAL